MRHRLNFFPVDGEEIPVIMVSVIQVNNKLTAIAAHGYDRGEVAAAAIDGAPYTILSDYNGADATNELIEKFKQKYPDMKNALMCLDVDHTFLLEPWRVEKKGKIRWLYDVPNYII